MSLAVVIATADRRDALYHTLQALSVGCRLPERALDVVVADNGTDGGTEKVCARDWPGLAVRHLRVETRGKTVAQNRAVEASDADLLVFTDDDVEFDSEWLTELQRAADRWPEHVLFGGRVLPLWPGGDTPPRLDGSAYLGPLYTLLDRGDVEGPLEGLRPFGPNMAVRRSVFDGGLRFDEAIGPGSASGVSMGDESDFARRLAATGDTAVYVPTSLVYHRVREEQLSLGWQLRRGILYGRMQAHFEGSASGPRLFGVPRWFWREAPTCLTSAVCNALRGRRQRAFDRLMDAAVAMGRARGGGERCRRR